MRFVPRLVRAEELMCNAKEEFAKHGRFYEMSAGVDGTVKVYVTHGDKEDGYVEEVFSKIGARLLWRDIDDNMPKVIVYCFILSR